MRVAIFASLALLTTSAAVGQPPTDAVGPVKPVEIVNEPLTVEGTVEVQKSEPERFQTIVSLQLADGEAVAVQRLNIPPGKRLLIDFISADVRTVDSQRASVTLSLAPIDSSISDTAGALTVNYKFPLTDTDSRISTAPTSRVWYLAEKVDLWADTVATVGIVRGPSLDGPFPDSAGTASGRITLSGRLVDLP